jgi:hypothetical protein
VVVKTGGFYSNFKGYVPHARCVIPFLSEEPGGRPIDFLFAKIDLLIARSLHEICAVCIILTTVRIMLNRCRIYILKMREYVIQT